MISLDFFGGMTETVTYAPVSGSPVSVTAAVNRLQYSQDAEYIVKPASITAESSDFASPNPDGDTFTFDGLVWDVLGYHLSGTKLVFQVENRQLIRRRPNAG
jgi:hypothetical protein